MFIGLLISIVNPSNHTKCASLNNKQCLIQPTLINLHPNEYTQGLRYYPVAVNVDRCVGSCKICWNLSNKLCVPNKTEDSNLSVFNMITRINESKKLTTHISCNVNANLMVKNVTRIKIRITINIDVTAKIQKNIMCAKKNSFGILLHVPAKLTNI